ncbi:MAG: hypothetical protein ACRC7O_11845, partial [Fimbriiglobus sp.]
SPTPPRLLDQDRIAAVVGDGRSLEFIPIPWDKLKASLRRLGDPAAADLTPAVPVALDVVLTAGRGDAAATTKLISEAITTRLGLDGLRVAPGGSVVVRVNLTEVAGETLPIVETSSPFDFRGRPTGRTATEAKGAAVVEILAKGKTEPLWRGKLEAGSSRSFREDITNDTIRQSMLDHITYQLRGLDIPYFVPKGGDGCPLPVVVR